MSICRGNFSVGVCQNHRRAIDASADIATTNHSMFPFCSISLHHFEFPIEFLELLNQAETLLYFVPVLALVSSLLSSIPPPPLGDDASIEERQQCRGQEEEKYCSLSRSFLSRARALLFSPYKFVRAVLRSNFNRHSYIKMKRVFISCSH